MIYFCNLQSKNVNVWEIKNDTPLSASIKSRVFHWACRKLALSINLGSAISLDKFLVYTQCIPMKNAIRRARRVHHGLCSRTVWHTSVYWYMWYYSHSRRTFLFAPRYSKRIQLWNENIGKTVHSLDRVSRATNIALVCRSLQTSQRYRTLTIFRASQKHSSRYHRASSRWQSD